MMSAEGRQKIWPHLPVGEELFVHSGISWCGRGLWFVLLLMGLCYIILFSLVLLWAASVLPPSLLLYWFALKAAVTGEPSAHGGSPVKCCCWRVNKCLNLTRLLAASSWPKLFYCFTLLQMEQQNKEMMDFFFPSLGGFFARLETRISVKKRRQREFSVVWSLQHSGCSPSARGRVWICAASPALLLQDEPTYFCGCQSRVSDAFLHSCRFKWGRWQRWRLAVLNSSCWTRLRNI